MAPKMTKKILAVLALAAGAFMWQGPALASQEEDEKGAEETAPAPTFVEFAPVSVSVVHNNRVTGFLSVAFGVMVKDPEAAAKVEALLPKISDACVQMLVRIARTRLDVTQAINIELLRTYLQRSVDGVIGEGVAQVLIQDATLQPR